MKERKFCQYIWDGFGQSKDYDLIKHRLLRIRNFMLEHKSFSRLSVRDQYAQCCTIAVISIHSMTKQIHDVRILKPVEKKVFKYAIDEGFVEPEKIIINPRKMIQ